MLDHEVGEADKSSFSPFSFGSPKYMMNQNIRIAPFSFAGADPEDPHFYTSINRILEDRIAPR